MRWLVRILILWAISAPLFYFVALPMLLDALTDKVRTQAHGQCVDTMRQHNQFGSPDSPLKPEQAEKYCQCVSGGLIFTRNDVFDHLRHRPTAALNALAASLSERCNAALQQEIDHPDAVPQPPEDPSLIHL